MGSISKILADLNKVYGIVSVGRMKDLCAKAGVPYREFSEAHLLVKDLRAKGYKIEMKKHNVEDVAVGQSLLLKRLDGTFVHGHQIWIDIQDEMALKDKELFSEDDIVEF